MTKTKEDFGLTGLSWLKQPAAFENVNLHFKGILTKPVNTQLHMQMLAEKSNAFAPLVGSLFLGRNYQQGLPVPTFRLQEWLKRYVFVILILRKQQK